MIEHARFVKFLLAGQPYAIALATVERVVRAVEVTPLPQAPYAVMGVIDLAGRIVPVFDLRKRLDLPARALALSDHFIIARAGARMVALVVDDVFGVMEIPAEAVDLTADIVSGAGHVQGLIKLEDGLVLVHDLATFLSHDEARALDAALESSVTHDG